mgnify:CR=1 FL=1
MTKELSRIRQVPVRDVWPHEAYDFTKWLLVNVDVLSDVLGLRLELTAAEYKVGGFSLDLIGTDVESGTTVIVENQLEQTDHGHLGQLLTYAGGTDPALIVWCAPFFREEHRAAIDWLNERTDERTWFFAVEISAVQIDDSRPAPLFRLVAKPNEWTKQVHTEKSAKSSGARAAYKEFWARLLERISVNHPDWTSSTKTSASPWLTLPYGSGFAWYAFVFSLQGPSVELFFGGSTAERNRAEYQRVYGRRGEIEVHFGDSLVYDPVVGEKACRISFTRPVGGDIFDVEKHEEYIDWFIGTMERFREATQRVRLLIANER